MQDIGIRVMRGPDWSWDNQDGGAGHVGTVVELGKAGSATSPEKTVVVQWDHGYRTNYRAGYHDGFDLRVIDNAPAGVKHPNIICDGCKKLGIAGMRWKCVLCYDYDLCTHCYMADHHDINHVFQRFETAASIGVDMEPRYNEPKLFIKGIFVGARVKRGPDWDWGNQDGGEGKTGRVIDVRGWDNESGRSVANVTWTSGSTNVYRLGHKGKVDLEYVEPACCGNYYYLHLPVLGQQPEIAIANPPGSPRHLTFNVGDKVKVLKDIDTLMLLQEGHGGWNQRMAEFIGQIGIVHRVTERGDIRVQYESCAHRWTFHPGAVTKVITFASGDVVKIKADAAYVREHQKNHGEWIDVMKNALGKMGKVVKLYPDGDLRVSVEGNIWTFNPLCVQLVAGSTTDINNTLHPQEGEKQPNPVDPLLPCFTENVVDNTSTEKLLREAALGRLEIVYEFIAKYPGKVNEKSSGKTILHVAAHQGHIQLVRNLLNAGALINDADEVGDTPLHYSAFGNQPEVMQLLITAGADINAINTSLCTCLHVSVNKQLTRCVNLLLSFHCNVNTQDSYGDTALHDAIGKENQEIVHLLISSLGIDYTLRNKRGFNVLHHAALKGNNVATEHLLSKARQLVDLKKDDGFAALHLASLNGHSAVVETLLTQGMANVNLRNNKKQTPLLLAVSQYHCAVIAQLCMSLDADIMAEDEDGDTALHLVLMKLNFPEDPAIAVQEPTIEKILLKNREHGFDHPVGVAIACFLVQVGCDLSKKNNKGQTPFDIHPDPALAKILESFHPSVKKLLPPVPALKKVYRVIPMEQGPSEESVPTPPEPKKECLVCSEATVNVVFEPCGDKAACEECASRMKRCVVCHEVISRKITVDGRVITCKERQSSTERLKYLETKIAEIEEAHSCSICMEKRRNVVFLCGHGACEKCAQTLKTCHMCRKAITKKINLY